MFDKERKFIKETLQLTSNVKKMIEDNCKLLIQYDNQPTGKIKKRLKISQDSYEVFIIEYVLNKRYNS